MKVINRIAMWSGPRNLSTALMRSFSSREDCEVLDEPFYASYLIKTGLNHPMRAEIIKTQINDPRLVAKNCTTGIIKNDIQYQKQMSHHLAVDFNKDFLKKLNNAFLIRHPSLVITSFEKKKSEFNFSDLGFQQQHNIFEDVANFLGYAPPVIDATDLRKNPNEKLNLLCNALGIKFSLKMLTWEKGAHSCDGVWGKHWYSKTNETFSFDQKDETIECLPEPSGKHSKMTKKAMFYYENLKKYKI